MKDPAFLFYPNDFTSTTATLNMKEKGQYITILCYQHQFGHQSKDTIKRLIRGTPTQAVMDLLTQDDQGLFYSPSLEAEIERRAKVSKRQSDIAKKRWE